MSHSVFKEQKCFNFRNAYFSVFPVEAADNLSNSLNESTAFLKKVFKEQSPKSATAQGNWFISYEAGDSSAMLYSRNP
jgi:hypothetical protein